MKKRIVSLLLALCLCAGFLSLTAQANGSNIVEGSAEYKELEDFLFDFWCGSSIYDFRNVSTGEINIMRALFSMIPAYRGPVPGADHYGVDIHWTGYDPLKKYGGYGYFKADGAQVEWILTNVFNCSETDISALRSSLGSDRYSPYYYKGDYYSPAGALGDSFLKLSITDITPYENYYFVTFEKRDDPEFTGSNDLQGRYFAVIRRKTMDNGTGYWSLYYYKILKDGEILDLPTASPSAPDTSIPETGTAYPSPLEVELDGKPIKFKMYVLLDPVTGYPTNYVKARDLALAMDGTKGQFNVGYDEASGLANLETGKPYTTPNGTENNTPFNDARSYKRPENQIYVDGKPSDLVGFVLRDDAGGDHTYFQLRDLGRKLGFNVGWDEARQIGYIESDKPYTG